MKHGTTIVKNPSPKLLKVLRKIRKDQELIGKYLRGEMSHEILKENNIKFSDVLKNNNK